MQEQLFQFPLKQHIGVRALPVVRPGEHVQRGQLLAQQPPDALGANLFSSVSGTVQLVSEQAVAVLADGFQSPDYLPLTGSDPLELIREAGLVGLGGAGFPTYAKLAKPFDAGGTVIVNAAECEPILSHNLQCIEENPAQLLRGLELVMEIMHASEGVIAIKAKHTAAIAVLEPLLEPGMRLALLQDLYPMGEERAIVREVLGTLLPVTALPLDAGAVVINAETVCRVQEAVDLKNL